MSYSFELLKQIHKQNFHSFVTKIFDEYNPLHLALSKFKPQLKPLGYQMTYPFWTSIIENSIKSDLSLALFDKQNNNQLVSTCLTFDITDQELGPPQYNQESPIMGPIVSLFDKMQSLLQPEYKALFKQKGLVAQIFAVAISPKYSGQKILYLIMEEALKKAREKNFKFVFLIGANSKTVTVVKKMGFNKILSIDAQEHVWNGQKAFQRIVQNQRHISMWLKQL